MIHGANSASSRGEIFGLFEAENGAGRELGAGLQ